MILAVGAADIVGGMFHLLSHAFFKSLLFLAAGCVIQALDEEHNIFKMGNLHRLMPLVSYLFLAGALCLSAFPLLGGYFSKDRILLATFIYPDVSYKILWFHRPGRGVPDAAIYLPGVISSYSPPAPAGAPPKKCSPSPDSWCGS